MTATCRQHSASRHDGLFRIDCLEVTIHMTRDAHESDRAVVRGGEISMRRLDAGWTQFDLAARAGVSVSSVYRAERGDTAIGPRVIGRIALALGIEPSAIYDGPVIALRGADQVRGDHQHAEIIERLDRIQASLASLTGR